MSFSIFTKCSGCGGKKLKLLVQQRTYDMVKIGKVTSDGKLCGTCYAKISEAVKHQLK